MKYGIRVKSYDQWHWILNLHEFDKSEMQILVFDSVSDAEEYAQNYEFNNYQIEAVNDNATRGTQQLLT